jgi:hypothetical protein
MSIALLRRQSVTANPGLERITEQIVDLLNNNPHVNERFAVVNRDDLDIILAEHHLSATVASHEDKLNIGNVKPAEMLLLARVHQDEGSIEIILEGSSTETSRRNAEIIDAAGPVGELDSVLETLSLRLVQEFPRVKGYVLDLNAPQLWLDYTRSQRVRPNLKCVVYKSEPMVHPITREYRGLKNVILGEGIIMTVTDESSEALVLSKEGEDVSAVSIEVGHSVVIK